ncbi:phage baseplate assembly protein V [Chryseobacterium sp. Ch-15]|uniref:Phage baseplate assembly protein V n=1 Tax=Chryseobacterium muglaense TaxID=2893752 RepID=A0A9Q3UXF9_9FLAO|nr:phage baseplate assembly protein V [Chryseobacterium muglaense]MBD3907185.1 Vgr family protein [Chryseobacterium muglaense]MCC9036362.1 phage baseplate assembly protein V [Chryseobacterium muglaense]MCM2556457.1 phage baseplate assembly protein V [Chryseobacterium muglaense]
MFQDNPIKPQLSDKIKSGAAQNLKEEVSAKITDKATENIKNVSQPINGAVQNSSGMFMNQMAQTNNPAIIDDKVWANQPTSKIHNALAIPTSQILGINRVVKLDLVIEGQVIKHFKHFKLNQSAIKHHEFSVTLAHDTLGSAENHNLEEAQNFLGKRLTVIFKYKDVIDGPERNFVGVITEVGFSQEKGSLGNIVLSGFSPTILLDAAPHIQSFGGAQPISLNSIADHVIKEGLGGNKFDFRVDAQYGNVSYSSQYEETHYNYLARMAEAYGEQFFYDGEVLHFGKLPPAEQPVKLTYGSNVSDIIVRMKAQHVNPSFYGYNSSKNEKLTTGNSKISHASDIAKRAYEISEKTFTTPSLRVAPIKAASFMDIDASQKGTAGSKASQVFITSGETTVPFLYPGCTADVEMRKQDTNQTSYFTKLMMVEVTHEVDARGYYTGNFEAIAADSGYIPRPEFESPRAEAQFAKVTANADPLNQGRVKIQFDWQSGQDTSEFIRVMTPDAGSSDKVNKNRGFMSVPEIGDQVIINFVHQHPDRPFVMGGMFHGAIGAGGGAGNNVMSFSGRSGAELKYDNGAGSMNLKDQGGANMFFDGAGNVVHNANNDSTKTVGNDKTDKVGNNKKLEVGCDHIADVGNTHKVAVGGENSVFKMDNAGVIDLTGVSKITLKVGSSEIVITGTKISITSSEVDIKAGSATANFKGDTKITGGQVDIN